MNKNPLFFPCTVLAAVSIASLTAVCVLAAENSRLKETSVSAGVTETAVIIPTEITSAQTELTETQTEPPETMPPETQVYTNSDGEPVPTVYIYDNGIDLIEFPEITGAKRNSYDMSLLETYDRKRKALFNESGEKLSRFGIDVSSYQTDINWYAAASDGVEFAMIRAGYRGYESGALCEDRYFRRNMEGASAAGVDIGVYFFSQAITAEEAAEEADYVIALLDEVNIPVAMPVVFDWEFPTDEDPTRTDGITGDIQTACCTAFCEKIAAAGYEPMYYATVNTAIFRYDMGVLEYPLWIAEYSADTDFVYDFGMWQYSCSGVVDGIEGLVDLNIYIEK